MSFNCKNLRKENSSVFLNPASATKFSPITPSDQFPLLPHGLTGSKRSGDPSVHFIYIFRFCFPTTSSINKVVSAILCWYKVSLYLNDVWWNVNKGPMSQILAVVVSFKESNWLSIGAMTSTSSFVLFCNMVQFLQSSGPMVMDCKSVLRKVMLKPMPLELLCLVPRGAWLLCSLKLDITKALQLLLFSVLVQYNFQSSANGVQSKKEEVQYVLKMYFYFALGQCPCVATETQFIYLWHLNSSKFWYEIIVIYLYFITVTKSVGN